MSSKRSYSRYFIILQEDEKGYSMSNSKFPTGYAKLEMKNQKCKLSFYIQNLKKDKEPYHTVLICSKKEQKNTVVLGLINIDEYGRSEVSYEYDLNKIGNTEMSMQDIKGAAVVKFNEYNMNCILNGFVSKQRCEDWKTYTIIGKDSRSEAIEEKIDVAKEDNKKLEEVEQEEQDEQLVEEKVENEENNIFDKYEEKIENVKEETINMDSRDVRNEEEKIEEIQKIEQIKMKEEVTEEKKVSIEKEEVVNERDDEVENNTIKEVNIKEEFRNKCKKNTDYPVGALGEFFKSLVDEFSEINDIDKNIKRCKWFKIPIKCFEDMDSIDNYNQYTIIYYPMVCYYPYVKKYGHYVIGYKCDKYGKIKYLIYGIPGTKSKYDQPYGGRSGFVTWIPKKEEDEWKKDCMGYWIMFYDFRKSTIVIPVR